MNILYRFFSVVIFLVFVSCLSEKQKKTTTLTFSSVPSKTIQEVYNKCWVVYNNNGRMYEKNAARIFCEFLKKNIDDESMGFFSELVDISGLQDVTKGRLVVFIGELDVDCTGKIWEKFDKDGYLISCEKDNIVVRGSNAENTYAAVNRLINECLHNNPDIISNIEKGKRYTLECAVTRQEYIEDISKLPAVWYYEWHPPAWIFDFEKKITEFKKSNGRPMAFAHRGDLESYPENSIEAIISAVLKGADAIEIDCAFTRDNVIVLNHGDDLEPTTDWLEKMGKTINGIQLPTSKFIPDWSYKELCQLRLRAGNGEYSNVDSEVSGYMIATLEEAFQVCNEKSFLSLDRLKPGGLSSPHWPQIYEVIKKTKAYRIPLYINVAQTPNDAYDLRNVIQSEFGISGSTVFDRTGTFNISWDWYAEFYFTTEDQFKEFYDTLLPRGSFIQVNRLSRLIDWIDKYHVR